MQNIQHKFLLKTPILFIIFNRPENTQKIFDQIKKIKPEYLYVHADGPRENSESDAELCKKTREIINQVDWECELKTLFREENRGIKSGVKSAIDWFFDNEEQGIVLEDDTLPTESFFYFCENLLEKYKTDTRIMQICGTSLIPESKISGYEYDYFFSHQPPIWGWATWRRAWKLYNPEMNGWQEFKSKKQHEYFFPSTKKSIVKNRVKLIDLVYRNEIETWDMQWAFSVMQNNGLAINPIKNLVTNIGTDGIHFKNAKNNPKLYRKTFEINTDNLKHPEYVMPDFYLQNKNMEHTAFNRSFLKRVRNFLNKIYYFFSNHK